MERQYKVMIVEDDVTIANLLETHLNKFGLNAKRCMDFQNLIEEQRRMQPDLILLDINLPFYDGFYWCRKLREFTACPILFLSARNTESDQVFAITNGGDDYITKPFSYEVVTAKVNAQLRRAYGEYAGQKDEMVCRDCTFSKSRLLLSCGKKSVELSKNEGGVIRLMFSKAPGVVRREELLSEIWDENSFVEENTLNVVISRVRRRLKEVGSSIQIKPVRGLGYRVGEEDEKERAF